MRIRDLVKTPMFWVFALVFVAVAYAIYSLESKGGNATAGTKNLQTTNPTTGETVSYQFNPRPYTDRLKETAYSNFFIFSDAKPYKDLLALKGAEIIAVAQDWNSRYYNLHQESLLQAINDEYLDSDLLAEINAKFASLNLS
jgi:hypothetical protein